GQCGDVTYGVFLLAFLCLPLVCLAAVCRRIVHKRLVVTLLLLSAVALLYTGPWDSAIIQNGVWSYGEHRVQGTLIGRVPIEEYAFYILQVCLTGVLTAAFLMRKAS
ncbi:MAG: lycopene cyclase domain-containing protein, partial [Chloroflexota bacterium]